MRDVEKESMIGIANNMVDIDHASQCGFYLRRGDDRTWPASTRLLFGVREFCSLSPNLTKRTARVRKQEAGYESVPLVGALALRFVRFHDLHGAIRTNFS